MYNINIIPSKKAENVFQHEDNDDTEQASKLLWLDNARVNSEYLLYVVIVALLVRCQHLERCG